MNEKITSYESLMEEQKRLKELLEIQKNQIQQDVHDLKQELRPVIKVMSFIGKLAIPDASSNSAVKAGAGLTIEWILSKVLSSSNPLLRLIVPALAKNYSSHYVGKIGPLFQKLKEKILPKKVSSMLE